MDNIEYTDKEIIIFNGLIKLIKEGNNPYRIKVSDIARAANIGKGTIYDYFESKEEAISKAILYYINKEIENIQNSIFAKESFKDKYYELLYNIKGSYESNMSIYNILLSSGGLGEFYEHLIDIDCDMKEFKTIVEDVIKNILNAGIEEGLVKKDKDQYYFNMGMRGAISGFSHYISKRSLYENIGVDRAMDVSYEILIKSLN